MRVYRDCFAKSMHTCNRATRKPQDAKGGEAIKTTQNEVYHSYTNKYISIYTTRLCVSIRCFALFRYLSVCVCVFACCSMCLCAFNLLHRLGVKTFFVQSFKVASGGDGGLSYNKLTDTCVLLHAVV